MHINLNIRTTLILYCVDLTDFYRRAIRRCIYKKKSTVHRELTHTVVLLGGANIKKKYLAP